MKKYIYIIIFTLISFKAYCHAEHYKGIIQIEMDVLRNGEVIGYSNYFFEYKNKNIEVKNYTKFKVEIFGATIFSISSESIENYENNQLSSYTSITFQNDKEKYVKLKLSENKKNFIIEGSSYKGKAGLDCVIGNWWNHKILEANKQISPLSGSIKEQVVNFIGKEEIIINNKKYLADHFKLKSKDKNLSKDKKLDFDIWYDSEKKIILKVAYKRMGYWEYVLKNIK